MPDDLGGQPFEDGQEPDNRHHGEADDEFATVVFDEDFVRAAEVHEPTAAERILAAAQSHAEGEAVRGHDARDEARYGRPGRDGDPADEYDEHGEGFDEFDEDEGRFDRPHYVDYGEADPYAHGYRHGIDPAFEHGCDYGYAGHRAPYGAHEEDARPYRGHARWQRPVAWVLAVVMGIGMVALAFSAVRGAGGQRQEPSPPPATTGVGAGAGPSASAETVPPAASAEPR